MESGDTISYIYDEADNLAEIIYPDGTKVKYQYDLNDNLTKVTDREDTEEGHFGETTYVYDAINRVTEIHRPNGISTYNTYNARNQITKLTNICDDCEWTVSSYTYTYDDRGFIAGETAVESLTGYAYDDKHDGKHEDGRHDALYPHGTKHNEKHQKDAIFAYQIVQTDRTFTYDDAGKLLSMMENEENYGRYTTTFAYDLTGNRTAIIKTDEKGKVVEYRKYKYNESNQVVCAEIYDGKKTTSIDYTYDADGNLISEIGRIGTDKIETTYDYGVENRLAAVYEADELLVAMAYDGDGNRVFQLNYNLHTDEDWKGNNGNGNGNNKDNSGSGNSSSSSSSNNSSSNSSSSDSSSSDSSSSDSSDSSDSSGSEDSDNSSGSENEDSSSSNSNNGNNGNGNSPSNGNNGNGNSSSSGNNGNSGNSSANNGKGGNGKDNGNANTNKTIDTGDTSEGENDDTGSEKTDSNAAESTSTSDNHSTAESTSTSNNHSTAQSSNNSSTGNGNATNAEENNSQNQSGILFPISSEVSDTEQGLIDLIKTTGKQKNYELIEYINDVNREFTEVLVEQNINGKTDTSYIYGADTGCVTGRLSLDRFDGSGGYYLYDPRGSVTGITNEEGQLYQSYRYNAYGEITFGAPQYENEYTYNGESYNPNIESQYLRARYYYVVTTSFLTEDSYLGDISQPLTLNRYLYCVASPLNYIDPSGHEITSGQVREIYDFYYGLGANGKDKSYASPQVMISFLSALDDMGSPDATVLYVTSYDYGKNYLSEISRQAHILSNTDYCDDIYYATDYLKVRDLPNGEQVYTVLRKGAIVRIFRPEELEKAEGSDYRWIKILYDDDKIGWVSTEFLGNLPEAVAGHDYKYNWDIVSEHVTPDFKDKVVGITKVLNIDPDDLMAIMAFESYLNPAQPASSSSAVGLVQFMPATAREIGTTSEELREMSGVEQLDYVFALLYKYEGEMKNLGDVYAAVHWPVAIGENDDYVLYRKDDKSYASNSGLDINKDGKVTKGEAIQQVIKRREDYE